MPIRLTHILDEATPEDGVRLVSLLLDLLPAGRVEQRLIVIGRIPPALAVPEAIPVARVARRFDWPVAAGLGLQRVLRRQRPEVILTFNALATAALGTAALHTAALGTASPRSTPLVVTISDPAEADHSSKWYRSLSDEAGGLSVICSSRFVQRKLAESGVPLASTAVIRPGVDFGAIRQARQSLTRQDLGLPDEGCVLLTASPPSRAGGQFQAVWAAALLRQIWPDLRLLIPGTSREQRRIGRMVEQIYCPEVFLLTKDRYGPAELLAVSDLLVAPAVGDIPTGPLAWAMSAGVPIVGSAVPAVAELIADRHNGFLCKPSEPHTLASRIRTAWTSDDLRRRCAATARSQAYETFGAQRCVDEYLKVIDNLAAGTAALANVQDSALDL